MTDKEIHHQLVLIYAEYITILQNNEMPLTHYKASYGYSCYLAFRSSIFLMYTRFFSLYAPTGIIGI